MKASELRIGNWIKDGNDFEQITIDHLNCLNSGRCNFDPIQLTEEWLLKFGFEKQHNEEDFDYWFKNDFSNDIIWEHSEGFCHNLNYGGDIKYVHQLQNLYFALTNEELTFKSE